MSLAVTQRAAGHTVLYAGGVCPDDGSSILREKAIARGLEPLEGLTLAKHRHRRFDAEDVELVGLVMSKERPQIVHTHMMNDHDIAVKAAARSDYQPTLVRTIYDHDLKMNRRLRALLGKTEGLVFLSRHAHERFVAERLFDAERCVVVEGAVDTERFAPRLKCAERQAEYGIGPDDFLVGIVARVQHHRRFEILLAAAKIATANDPHVKFMIVGRGTHLEEIAKEPVQRMGLVDRVIFSGYRSGDYVDTINLFDAKVFLVPGSDGSCRAVRELMAIGKPVIAANRGMLPEIVTDGVDGLVIDDTPENLAEAILALAADRGRATRMGEAAAKKAVNSFGWAQHAAKVEDLYKQLLEKP